MKLLILTQKVDKNDPILGFFHRWLVEFAKHCEQVTVIALGVGEHDLPDNVRVFSLGKEKHLRDAEKVRSSALEGEELRKRSDLGNFKRSVLEEQLQKIKYVIRFYRLIWRERNNYDTVFVHMNQEYVLLGGLVWKFLRKKVTMWRNHQKGNILTNIATILSDKVFCTSKYSYTARFKKTVIMPVGIDTSLFKRDETIVRTPNSILFLGRISPVKNVHLFIEALTLLDERGVAFAASIYGDPSARDAVYYKRVRNLAAPLEEKGRITFHKGVPNTETPALYLQHDIFVNATLSGSFDKTILEAMACERLVIACNDSLKDILPAEFIFKEGDAESLAEKLKRALMSALDEKENTGKTARAQALKHDVSILADKVFDELR